MWPVLLFLNPALHLDGFGHGVLNPELEDHSVMRFELEMEREREREGKRNRKK